MIETDNLRITPCEPPHLTTVLEDEQGLESLLGVPVPVGWPVFPEASLRAYGKLGSDPSSAGWWSRLFVHTEDKTSAGDGGFRGRPNGADEVEIGYALVPECRGRGLATEAATVRAETFSDGHPPVRVLEKLGIMFVGATGGVLRWWLDRQHYGEGGAP